MTTTINETDEIDHSIASEKHRLETFDCLLNFPSATRHQLALAGFIFHQSKCICSQCGVVITLEELDDNAEYASNYFWKLHREKVVHHGKHCSFLLCKSGTNIDDLRPPLTPNPDEQPQWDDAENPEYSNYTTRIQSFDSWPYLQQDENAQNTFVTRTVMAKHGFYFSGPDDGVTCFYCGNTLVNWSDAIRSTDENIVQLEHARFFPCRFVTYTAGGKFVASAGYFNIVSDEERRSRNPIPRKPAINSTIDDSKPQSPDECLSTFETWPEEAPVSPNDLARNGFYYLGANFQVKCYRCGLEVDNWHYGDNVFDTHRRRRNSCEIVQAILNIKSGDIQSVNEKWRLQTLIELSCIQSSRINSKQTEYNERLCRELAACGFYCPQKSRNIRCAYCTVIIHPKPDHSVMSQHRFLAKQLKRISILDCPIVRAQCPTNIVISERQRFPEFPLYEKLSDRLQSFETYKEQHKNVEKSFIRTRADAGFFLDTLKRMRCFQCGNSLPINGRKLHEKHSQHDVAKLHAHLYPTCEWIKEILGVKYVSQVLHDRRKSKEIESQQSYMTQSSSASSPTTLSSNSSVTSTPSNFDATSPLIIHHNDDSNMSECSDEADDEVYEPVALPCTAYYNERISPIQSPPILSPPAHESTRTQVATQAHTDLIVSNGHSQLTLPLMEKKTNPFEELALQPRSPPIDMASTDISPVDPRASFMSESSRLDSFKKRNCETFAQVKVEELAYVGFYLNGEGTTVQCPWCSIELTEQKFEDIMHRRPTIPGSPLNNEPWTPMAVHRHEMGQYTSDVRSWCPWVRRLPIGLYRNVIMNESRMGYPEYPSYSNIEKRIKSFEAGWIYPGGSRLSNEMMAEAGFIHLGEGKVCCYYCGNKLIDFEPLDCPFEEHATFHPLCDYIIDKRKADYVDRIYQEADRTLNAKQKYEIHDTQRIKRIYFDRSGLSRNKTGRIPVKRVLSYPPRSSSMVNRSTSRPTTMNLDINGDECQLCYTNPAQYQYDPCQHSPMCGKCVEHLKETELIKCIFCFNEATIRSRIPITPF